MAQFQVGPLTLLQYEYVLTPSGTIFGISGILGAAAVGKIKIGNAVLEIKQEILPLTVFLDNYSIEVQTIDGASVTFNVAKLADEWIVPILKEIEIAENETKQAYHGLTFRMENVDISNHRFNLFVNNTQYFNTPDDAFLRAGDEGRIDNFRFVITKDNFFAGQPSSDRKINISLLPLV